MAFTAKDVQALREKTGVGMMDCKKALQEADGDMDKAVELLREKGLASQAKKASRVAAEGAIGVYSSETASALVELNCETDFVGKNPEFKALADRIAKTVVLSRPADLDALNAATIADGEISVQEAIQELFLKIRENLKLRRFELVEGVAVPYIHAGGSVGVLVSFDTNASDKPEFAEMGKNIAMQVAAMSPEYRSHEDISAEELAKMRNIIVESTLNNPDTLPKPIMVKVINKAIADGLLGEEDLKNYEEQKNNKFLFNFLSKEAVASFVQVALAGKDEYTADPIFAKAIDGRVSKQLKEICLLDQAFVRSDVFEGNVGAYIEHVAKVIGSEIKLTGFVRFAKGEGIEKKTEDFAAEIAKMVK